MHSISFDYAPQILFNVKEEKNGEKNDLVSFLINDEWRQVLW